MKQFPARQHHRAYLPKKRITLPVNDRLGSYVRQISTEAWRRMLSLQMQVRYGFAILMCSSLVNIWL